MIVIFIVCCVTAYYYYCYNIAARELFDAIVSRVDALVGEGHGEL